jgi:hypothetical protein
MAEPTESSPLESFSKFTGLPVKELTKPKDALTIFSDILIMLQKATALEIP